MAYEFYITIKGSKSGQFNGEATKASQKGKIAGLAFHLDVTSPRSASSGVAIGKRQYQPLQIVKEMGAASPQLFNACVTNETLTDVLFEFISTDEQGKETVYQTIKLTNASISGYRQDVQGPAPGTTGSMQLLEEVDFAFQTIQMQNNDTKGGATAAGSTSATDNWTTNASVRTSNGSLNTVLSTPASSQIVQTTQAVHRPVQTPSHT